MYDVVVFSVASLTTDDVVSQVEKDDRSETDESESNHEEDEDDVIDDQHDVSAPTQQGSSLVHCVDV